MDYFKSTWNINDILYIIFAFAMLVIEFVHLQELSTEDESVDGRMLAKKKKGGSEDDELGSSTRQEESNVKQWLRLSYSVMIFLSFVKILQLA